MSITVRARDWNTCLYTWRTRHAVTTCLITCVCDVSTAPLASCLTHKSLGHAACQIRNYVMTGRVIIQQVNVCGRFDLPFKHDSVAIKACINTDLILFEVVLNFSSSGIPPPLSNLIPVDASGLSITWCIFHPLRHVL
jgi:hypothetical protein